MQSPIPDYVAFEGSKRIAAGSLEQAARKAKDIQDARPQARLMVFRTSDSQVLEIDYRGNADQVVQRLLRTIDSQPTSATVNAPSARPATAPPAGPGRPKLGVVAREVTLLPRHWEWLSSQPGGASVALRKLVELARKASEPADRVRQAQETTYRFMSTMAGHLTGFEEAARALFAADAARFAELLAPWPADIRSHLQMLATTVFEAPPEARQEERSHA